MQSGQAAAAIVTPCRGIIVEPAPVAEMDDVAAMWATAALAPPPGAVEADDDRSRQSIG